MKNKLLSMIILIFILALTGCGKAGSFDQAGKKSFANGKYDKAAESFMAAIKENPNRADYYIDYGMALIALGKYEDALLQFDRAYIDKDMLIIRENNKRALRGKGIAYFQMKEYTKAIEELKQALQIEELSNLNKDITYYMADALSATGAYGKAIKAYSSVIALDKRAVIAYSKRAICYKSLGEYEKSLADYDNVIKLEPKNYNAYLGKYYLLTEMKDDTGMLKVLEDAEAIVPKTNEDKYNLAKIHYFQGEYDAALTELNDGYSNGILEAYYYLGETYRIQKDYEKAIYYYKNYIDSGAIMTSNVYNQIAICLMKVDQSKDALQYVKTGIAYNNAATLQILQRNEIILYEKTGNYEEAKQELDQYIKTYPKDTQAAREAEFVNTRVEVIPE